MTYLVNMKTGATAEYNGIQFTSLWRDADGHVYGTAADGIYELTGDTDAGVPIKAVVGFGTLDMGALELKHIPNVYVGARSDDKMLLRANNYEYEARSYDENLRAQRFDLGKGLRANYLTLEIYNTVGTDFEISTAQAAVVPTARRI